jgi:transcriptional regulator with XRE-family HTH domain
MDAVIAAQVAKLREQRGWSQARLGEALGVSTSVVQQLETGRRSISVQELLLLSATLDTAPVELIGATHIDIKRVPLFQGRRPFPRRLVRSWAAHEPGAKLPGMDERRYSEQISDDEYLARKRVTGLEELQALLVELGSAAVRGNERQIDDCLRALEAQVRHVRHAFGRKRGRAVAQPRGSGSVEVIRGNKTGEEGESHAS